MSEKKNYLNNEDLKDEILKCITKGYEHAISMGYQSDDGDSDFILILDTDEKMKKFNDAVKLGYDFERSKWINKVRKYDKNKTLELVKMKIISKNNAEIYEKQMIKPVVSDRLGRMFQLMVDNVSRSFYWQNPDDGLDCKANALLDLCSNFWKFEPANPETGKANSAFAFCTQIAYFGIAGAHRLLHPKKYEGTISMTCLDENGKLFDLYNI